MNPLLAIPLLLILVGLAVFYFESRDEETVKARGLVRENGQDFQRGFDR